MVAHIAETKESSLDIAPVHTNSHFCNNRDRKLRTMLHLSPDQLLELLGFLWNHIEEQLVVNLKRHLRLQPAVTDELIDLQHRQLDQIGSSSLQWSIDCRAFGKTAHVRVARLNIRNRANTAEVCSDGLVAAHSRERLFDEPLNAFVTFEVRLDVLPRRLLVDIQLRSKPKRADAVNNPEVDRLRAPARLFVHRRRIDAKDLASRQRMNILTGPIRVEQQWVLREVSHQPQLNLRVIRRHQHIPRSRNERRTDLAANRSADRNVLQIWISRRQTPRCRANLVERCMNATLSIGQLRQRIQVR